MTENKTLLKLIDWATGDTTGASSKYLCRFMLEIDPTDEWFMDAPSDASDRNRCIHLLNLIPEWWERLDEMNKVSIEWQKQIPLIKKEANRE